MNIHQSLAYDISVFECINGDEVIFGARLQAIKLEKSLASNIRLVLFLFFRLQKLKEEFCTV